MFAKSPSWPFPLFGPGTAESPHPPRARHASIFFCILSSVHPSARAHLQTRTPRCVSFLVLCQAAGLTIMFISAWYRCRKTCNWHSDKTDRQTDRQTDGPSDGHPAPPVNVASLAVLMSCDQGHERCAFCFSQRHHVLIERLEKK